MKEKVIEVKGISKKYKILTKNENKDTFMAVLFDSIKGGFKRKKEDVGEFWALKDVNFTVNKGEIFGFLGPSGAGKSTLQKVLTGLCTNYQGTAKILGLDSKKHDKEF